MNRQEISKIIAEGENQNVEFKANLRDPNLLAKLISSFANANGGALFIGISDSLHVVGCDPDSIKKIYKKAQEILNPVPVTDLALLEFEGKVLGVITVKSTSEVVFSNGGAYVRGGDSIQAMTSGQITHKLSYNPHENLHKTIKSLADAIERQTKTIDKLHQEVKESGSLRNKLKDYVIGGIIGAILGLLATLITT